MNRLIYITIVVVSVLTSNNLLGQRNANKADRYFDKNLFEEAIKYYEIEAKTGDREAKNYAKKQLAECFRIIGEFEEAEKAYRKILKNRKNREDASNFMNYGKSLKSSAKFAEAKLQFEEYIKLMPDDPMGPIFLKSCDSAQLWLDETMGKTAKNLENINTPDIEFAPVYVSDNVLLFSSSREDSKKPFISFDGGMNVTYLDFYEVNVSEILDTNISVRNVEEFNTTKHEGPATFSLDGEEVYFTRTVKGEKDKRTGKLVNTLQVFYSKKDSIGNWIEPVSAFPFNSSDYSVGHPSLSVGGDTIYFMSDMPKGFGNTDIYYSVKDSVNVWRFPVNMGDKVNTFGHELFPYIGQDGKLYFSSDSHPGMGKLDIFSSQLKYGEWGNVKNLKPPVNSIGNDFSITLDGEDYRGFFTSDRFNGKGAEDIYSFGEAAVIAMSINNGIIEIPDKKIFDGLKYKLICDDLGMDSTLVSEKGKYHLQLETGKEYTLSAKKNVFSTYNKITLKLVGDAASSEFQLVITPHLKEVALIRPTGNKKFSVEIQGKKEVVLPGAKRYRLAKGTESTITITH